jgi:hypothetical protein
MADGLYIDEVSMKNLRINMKAFQKEVLKASVRGLSAFGMQIVAEAQRLLKANGNVASSHLRNSGRTVVQPDNTVDAGFYMGYAEYVEYGRKSGKMPPVETIYQWIRRKRIVPSTRKTRLKLPDDHIVKKQTALRTTPLVRKESKHKGDKQWSLAWAIALWIKEHGTKAHPFLHPAYEKYRGQITEFMQRRINDCCEYYKKK